MSQIHGTLPGTYMKVDAMVFALQAASMLVPESVVSSPILKR